ncbi:hypothetical protein LCM4576_29560 [Mesorhizobium sp. LCM 4576]|nr:MULTISPECIES: nitrogen fixation protein NifQ [unclassified Mesorhizobium]OHV62843.1 hypothetical protein LCM4576_31775 [Mesorhizobium sp. LCM 4576]OHV64155.1 hypothetical protein LCM4576_29560 [Mesorhizobium sp. LCM 4576]
MEEKDDTTGKRLNLWSAPAGPPLSTSFAKTIAHRAMHTDCLRQDLGLFDRHEISRLLATHLPAHACQDFRDFDAYFRPEEGDIHSARVVNGWDDSSLVRARPRLLNRSTSWAFM